MNLLSNSWFFINKSLKPVEINASCQEFGILSYESLETKFSSELLHTGNVKLPRSLCAPRSTKLCLEVSFNNHGLVIFCNEN